MLAAGCLSARCCSQTQQLRYHQPQLGGAAWWFAWIPCWPRVPGRLHVCMLLCPGRGTACATARPLGARMARKRSIAVHAAAAVRRVFSVGRQWQAVCAFLCPLASTGGGACTARVMRGTVHGPVSVLRGGPVAIIATKQQRQIAGTSIKVGESLGARCARSGSSERRSRGAGGCFVEVGPVPGRRLVGGRWWGLRPSFRPRPIEGEHLAWIGLALTPHSQSATEQQPCPALRHAQQFPCVQGPGR